ncbi:thiamine-phosphate kinase [Microvirga flavescens]|uniref:thiamine-phosphate kinase n=1 Tax=Microvirga flavescens TaxID=2249811 RepID=UPI000DD77BB7|nr:thiamine-phosphate kinase [Microvirga flavescens]
MSSHRSSEDDLIANYFAPIAGEGAYELKDDAASYTPRPGHDLILTTDALVEGGHFLPDDPPGSLARKALGVNVSDLAAKGAEPRGFLLTLALPENWTEEWLAAFAAGLKEASADFGCPLLGGDTVKARGALTLSVTAIGEVPTGRMVRRTTAQADDLICVTGTIGDGALGLDLRFSPAWGPLLSSEERTFLTGRNRNPQPRFALATALRDHANAAMDVSDGLAGDLAKMLRVSGVTGIVETASVPLSPAAAHAVAVEPALMDRVLTGGDDYEVLCTVSPDSIESFSTKAAQVGIALTVIGRVVSGDGLPLFRADGRERRYEHGSFSHF